MKILSLITYKRLFWSTCAFGILAVSSFLLLRKNNYKDEDFLLKMEKGMTGMLSELPVDSSDVLFVGTSLTQFFPVTEIYGPKYKNRGIMGNTTALLLNRIESTVNKKPEKIFIEIGVNDITTDVPVDTAFNNFEKCITIIKKVTPGSKVFVQSVTPLSQHYAGSQGRVLQYNALLKNYCKKNDLTYIDLYSAMLKAGKVDSSITIDGVHFNKQGYSIWERELQDYIHGNKVIAVTGIDKINL